MTPEAWVLCIMAVQVLLLDLALFAGMFIAVGKGRPC